MHPFLLSGCLFALVALCAAQDSAAPVEPVPVDHEPHHKVVMQNQFVQVLRVTLPVGGRTLYHTHSHDRAAVELCTTTISQQILGQPEPEGTPIHPGQLFIGAGDAPYTHRVHNLGPVVFDVLDVEFLQRPATPAPTSISPIAGENPSARAYHWVLAPGAKTPMHTHTRPYLIVAATPIHLTMTSPDGQSMTHDVAAGDFHWIDSQVTHSLANAGSAPAEIIELELK